MNNTGILKEKFQKGELNDSLTKLYGEDRVAAQKNRYMTALEKYEEFFGCGEVECYSAPGRTEMGGNHTDHQHGMVLAASVDLDTIAIAGKHDKQTIELLSEGYGSIIVDLEQMEVDETKYGTTEALVRGIVVGMQKKNYQAGPFRAYITSNVLNGAGISSSAAFETLIGTILSGLYNEGKVSPVEIAMIGQYSENEYFGKPCGLMDEMACSVGGIIHIDFEKKNEPIVRKLEFDLSAQGYDLCLVDTKGSHADLTDDYAAVPREMKEIAAYFGKQVLREVSEEEFYKNLPSLREKVGDRGVLRAIHFFNENRRVAEEAKALESGDFQGFLRLVKASGDSSYKYLQNIYSNKDVQTQSVSLALALSEHLLGKNGVCRVHGGGFAGTIQAYVKKEAVAEYKKEIEKVFGENTCHVLGIRKYGGIRVV